MNHKKNYNFFICLKRFYRYIMGRVPRKKLKRNGSVSKKSKNLCSAKIRRSKAISGHTVMEENIAAESAKDINKTNKHSNSSIEVMEISDNSLTSNSLENIEANSSIPVSNIKSDENDIIDITGITFIGNESEKTVSSKVKTYNIEDDIIDITDTTIDDSVYENSKTVSSNKKMPFCNDVQIHSHTTCAQNNSIVLITISDDSDEENTPHQQSNKKPIVYKSIKERLGAIVNTKKRTYNSPLRNRKKISKDESDNNQEILSLNLGAFVIDKQKISHHSQCSKKFETKTAMFPQPHKDSSSTKSLINRKLRPIIIDGLNIGHA